MPPIDVGLVRGKHNLAAVGAESDVLDFKITRGQLESGAAGSGDGIQMHPARAFPREEEASVGPEQLFVGHYRIEHATASRRSAPEFAAVAGGYIRDADGPRFGADPRSECEQIVRRRNADEGDLERVGGPNGLAVEVDGGIEIPQGFGGGIEDADKGVISTAAHEGELRTIRRPSQRLRVSASVHSLLGFVMTIKPRPPDLPLAEKSDAIAFGRSGGVMAFAEFSRITAVERNDPQRLFDALRITAWVWSFAAYVEIAAANEHDGAAVGRPAQLVDVLAVIVRKVCNFVPAIIRRRGGPNVAGAACVHLPGHAPAGRSRHEGFGKWIGQRLLQREGFLGEQSCGGEEQGGSERCGGHEIYCNERRC